MSYLSLLLLAASALTGAITTPVQRSASSIGYNLSCVQQELPESSDVFDLKTSVNISKTVIECIYLDEEATIADGRKMRGSNFWPDSISPTKTTVSDLVCLSVNLQASTLIGASVTVTESLLAFGRFTPQRPELMSHYGLIFIVIAIFFELSHIYYSIETRFTSKQQRPVWRLHGGYSGSPSSSSSGYGYGAAAAPASYSSEVDLSICLAFSENYGLKTSVNISATIVECIYLDEATCHYNRKDGSMIHGSKTCPGSINPTKITPEFVCVPVNLQESILIGASVTVTENFLACTQVSLLNGGNSCPTIVTVSVSILVTPSFSSSTFVCEQFDHNSFLLTSHLVGEFLVCAYSDKTSYSYFVQDGEFDSGSSVCQQSISPVVDSTQLSGQFPPIAATAASPCPILIALLAMNGVLVLAVLSIAGVRIFGRRSEAPARLRPLNTYKTVDSESVPLTHSDDGHYYDAPKRLRNCCETLMICGARPTAAS
ncbi:hypothetical protein B0H13DRAFT_2343069 [Mycena leptocephala]|nr:hypothetical protein B0H13DRAFT_2343069 [Mycena leptocephala]